MAAATGLEDFAKLAPTPEREVPPRCASPPPPAVHDGQASVWKLTLTAGDRGPVYRSMPPGPQNWFMGAAWTKVDTRVEVGDVTSELYFAVENAVDKFVQSWKSEMYEPGKFESDVMLVSVDKPVDLDPVHYHHVLPEHFAMCAAQDDVFVDAGVLGPEMGEDVRDQVLEAMQRGE